MKLKYPGSPKKNDVASTANSGNNPKIAVAEETIADTTIAEASAAENIIEDISGELSTKNFQTEKSLIALERELTLGMENRELVEITSGLKEGDLLVVLGYETLSDKVDVNITYRDKTKSGIQQLTK